MSLLLGQSGLISVFGSTRARLGGVVALFGLGLVAMGAAMTWFQADEIYAARKDQLQVAIDLAYSTVERQYEDFKAGKISEAEAQERAKANVRALRYNGSGYFFINDKNVITLVNGPRPDQEGRDVSTQKDGNGKYFARDLVKIATEKGQGFNSYEYTKPGQPPDKWFPKLSYVHGFAPWAWSIGTGVYVDDLQAKVWKQIYLSSGVAALFLLTIGVVSAFIVFGLSKRLAALASAMMALASGNSETKLPVSKGDDELGRMIKAVHVFQDAARQKAQLEAAGETARQQAEAARVAYDEERADKERNLQCVTGALAIGLEKLANGDLAYRIETPFETKLDKLRTDFNNSVERLRRATAGQPHGIWHEPARWRGRR